MQGPRIAAANGHDIIACAMCGFRHAVPLPDPDALEREYRENYYAEEKPTFLAHAGEDQDWSILAQSDRLEAFERILGPAPPAAARHRLGPRLLPARRRRTRGWSVQGIEPSRQAAAHARDLGVEVVEGFFNARNRAGRWAASMRSI